MGVRAPAQGPPHPQPPCSRFQGLEGPSPKAATKSRPAPSVPQGFVFLPLPPPTHVANSVRGVLSSPRPSHAIFTPRLSSTAPKSPSILFQLPTMPLAPPRFLATPPGPPRRCFSSAPTVAPPLQGSAISALPYGFAPGSSHAPRSRHARSHAQLPWPRPQAAPGPLAAPNGA